jgi:hypothetical protein
MMDKGCSEPKLGSSLFYNDGFVSYEATSVIFLLFCRTITKHQC